MTLRTPARLVLGVALALASGAALLWGGWAYRTLAIPYSAWDGKYVDVEIEPGLSAAAMVRRLADAGVLRDPRLVRAWVFWSGAGHRLQAGEYRFDRPASGLEVLARLRAGDVLLRSVTLPEGLRLAQIAERVAQAGFGTAEALLEAFHDPEPIRDLDTEASDLEGYLFPDTYHFPRGVKPRDVARRMVERFREVNGTEFIERARQVGLGLRGAVVLASMIEEETSVPEERRRVSRVFHNRLARGMKLECDPTVRYALHREGRGVDRLLYEHLRIDSPWNTYKVTGLPAGPIANPGQASLDAALDPEEGDELFFVAAPDGGHRFSANLAEHLEAVAEWRRYVRSSR